MSKDGEQTPNDTDAPVLSNRDRASETLIPSEATLVLAPTPKEESAAFAEVALQTVLESDAAAERLSIAQAKLAQMKTELGAAVDSKSVKMAHTTRGPAPDDVDTEIDESPDPLVPSSPDPLNAAEQALALAAKARGVPLELPSRIAPDRSDPFAAATRALETARVARGGAPKTPTAEAATPSSRARDPFKAAEEALERAAAVRAEVGVSPDQEQREAAARSELARLRRMGPPAAPTDDDDAPPRKKRDL